MVGFGLLAAGALGAGRGALEKRSWRLLRVALALELALVVGVVLDICLTNQRVIQQGLDPPMPQTPASADFFQNTGADYSRLPTFPVQGFGTRACYVALEWKPAPGITDGRGAQARVEPPSAGAVVETSWSPNRLELDVRLDAPATVIINQNYETGWRAKSGRGGNDGPATVGAYVVPQQRFWDVRARPAELPVKGAIGLLAVSLPAGARHLVLLHRPPWLWLGGFLSLAGLALAVVIVRRARR